MKNKLIPSMWSTMLVGLSPYDAVLTFKECGFCAMELSREHFLRLYNSVDRMEEAKKFLSFIGENEFCVSQGHLPMYDIVFGRAQEAIDDFKRFIDYFMALGVENIVMHVGRGMTPPPSNIEYDEVRARRIAAVAQLEPLVRGSGSYLCLENLRANTRTSRELLDILEAFDSPNLAVCYDTGHLNQNHTLESQTDFVAALSGRIRALHINNNDGIYEQHLFPYSMALNIPEHGSKPINEDEILLALKKADYKGLFNLELPGENVAPLPILKAKIEYAKRLLDYMLSRMDELE